MQCTNGCSTPVYDNGLCRDCYTAQSERAAGKCSQGCGKWVSASVYTFRLGGSCTVDSDRLCAHFCAGLRSRPVPALPQIRWGQEGPW